MPPLIDLTVSSDDIEGPFVSGTSLKPPTSNESINKHPVNLNSMPGIATQPRSKRGDAPVKIRRNTALLPKHITPIVIEDEDDPIQEGGSSLKLPIFDSNTQRKAKQKSRQQERIAAPPDPSLFFFDYGSAASPRPLPQSNPPDTPINAPAAITLDSNDLILPNHVYIDKGSEDACIPPSSTDTFLHFLDANKTAIRYFDANDAKACGICGGSGHKPKSCPVEVCLTCGEKGGHKTKDCPIALTCWNCGSRGHMSADCPEPRSGRTCSRCGSHQHVQNSCPTIWRVYSYLSNEEREKALVKQAKKSHLDFTNGGEGFIAWDRMCFECGESDHWGFECRHSSTGITRRLEPHAFSNHIADAGRFGDGYPSRNASRRTLNAIASLRDATDRLRYEEERRDRESTTFVDGYGFVAEAQVGRKAKRRNMQRARDLEQEREQEDVEDDWFSQRAKPVRSSKDDSQTRNHHSNTRTKKKSAPKRSEAAGLRRTEKRTQNRHSRDAPFEVDDMSSWKPHLRRRW